MSSDPAQLSPLDLTVHSRPSVQQLSQQLQDSTRQRSGRWKMLVLLAVCAAPVVASYFTYYVLRPEGRRNFGELIAPQRSMPADLVAQRPSGERVPLAQLQGQWLLVSTASAACEAPCETHLYLQRQLRESLGREKARLDWVWLVQDDAAPQPALQQALAQAQAQVLHLPTAELQRWLQPAPGQQLKDHLYVVDPQGHWMMRFPAGVDASQAARVRRDLERLLRASASWDRAGR